MIPALIILAATWAALITVIALAACRAAGLADRRAETLRGRVNIDAAHNGADSPVIHKD